MRYDVWLQWKQGKQLLSWKMKSSFNNYEKHAQQNESDIQIKFLIEGG